MSVHNANPAPQRPLGVAIVGLGGAVATTAVAGATLIGEGRQDTTGLPLAEFADLGLVDYGAMRFAGWDLYTDDLAKAARHHGVLTSEQVEAAEGTLSGLKPWPALANKRFCGGVVNGDDSAEGLRDQVTQIQRDLAGFREEIGGPVVVLNLASTEAALDPDSPAYQSPAAFEAALDADDESISPGMLYAYACITSDTPYGNFTPTASADIPALRQLAAERGVPVAGKDGKTGQTFVKTVIAPALRARALHVDGWFSTNILGNRDGEALRNPESLKNKITTKGDVLGSCLGYPVDDHVVMINYYKPRGDDKEAWDNIDVSGFLGHRMQLKVNFLCKDSVLAAPLALEIARCLELAHRKGQGGVVEEMGVFFKAPSTQDGSPPPHAFDEQQRRLVTWLEATSAREDARPAVGTKTPASSREPELAEA